MSDPVRALVLAYHNVGRACLEVLIDAGIEVAALVTHEDDPEEEIWFSSVAELARRHRIPVHTPSDVRTPEFVGWVESLKPDVIFSFYFRYLLPGAILNIPPLGALNMHGSYLPKYRGRCPVNWVLVNGESETGVTLHYMTPQADRGDIVGQKRIPIDPMETARDLFDKITAASGELLGELLPRITAGSAPRVRQKEEDATCFGGRRPEDGRIDWNWDARRIHNLVRAVTHPYPGAFTYLEGRKILIWKAAPLAMEEKEVPGRVLSVSPLCVAAGSGMVELRSLQWQGEAEEDAGDFAKHSGISPGMLLGRQEKGNPV